MNRCLITILLICFFGCSSQSPNFFIGKWQILIVVENDQHIILKNNWMHLKDDGSFDSYDGNSDKSETGNWEYEPKEKILNINGNATGEEDDSKWILLMRNDTLIFSSSENNLYLKAIKMK